MHKLHFKYDKENLEISVLRLSHLLDGREDTSEKRDLYKFHDENSDLNWQVVKKDGLIYPQWCLDEFKALKKEHPAVYRAIKDIGINYE
jgi:hypothetical protein